MFDKVNVSPLGSLRRRLKRLFFGVICCLQVPAVFRFFRRDRITILMFHGLTDRDHVGTENYDHKHLRVEKLDQCLGHLVGHYHIIALEKVLAALAAGEALPRNPVILTFDDGYESNYRLGFPLLKKYGVPATIFLATDFVDRGQQLWTSRIEHAFGSTCEKEFRGKVAGQDLAFHLNSSSGRVEAVKAVKGILKTIPQETLEHEIAAVENTLKVSLTDAAEEPELYRRLVWPQAKEMLESGLVSFGSHTHTHRILGRCQPETIRTELTVSRDIIERATGLPCRLFCYPNGGKTDISEESERILRELNYSCALTTLRGDNGSGDSPFLLRRLGVSNEWDFQYFTLAVSGFVPWFENVTARIRSFFTERNIQALEKCEVAPPLANY